tara:strand:+ start:613 stop:5568 length:4956 start_codon:yes stop_codon:yes gene_type:complete
MDEPQNIISSKQNKEHSDNKKESHTEEGVKEEIEKEIEEETFRIEEEYIDTDFQHEDENIPEEVDKSKNIHIHSFEVDTTFIIIFEEGEDLIDKLLTVKDIIYDNKEIHFLDENQNNEILFYDEKDNLIIDHDTYHIFEIEKVEAFIDDIIDFDQMQEEDKSSSEIEILVQELEEKIYSLTEKKESLITELITIFNAFNNKPLIYNLITSVNELIDLYINKGIDPIEDSDDTLLFLQKMKHGISYEIPRWIIPIIQNQKKIYHEFKSLEKLDEKDIFTVNFEEEFMQKYTLLNSMKEDNHYRKYIHILDSFSPYQQDKDSIQISYHGTYLRDCSIISPCNGLHGELTFDMNQTMNELYYSFMKDNKSQTEIIRPKERLSLKGFYLLPHTFLDITFLRNVLSMHELYFLSDYKYSHLSLKHRFMNHKIIPMIINQSNNKNTTDDLKQFIYSYKLEKNNISYEQLYESLINNLQGYTNLLNSIPTIIQNHIYNYSDFKRAYLCYDIQYHSLNKENRIFINQLIKKNIDTYISSYNQSVQRKIVQKVKVVQKSITLREKITLSKAYIMGLHIIPKRNYYLQKFIDTFSREPYFNENKNFLYEKNSNDKLLCKHYLYLIQSDKDPLAFNTLKTVYCDDEIHDGMITCKICKEYLCHEEFTPLQGFANNMPVSTNEVLNTELDETNALTAHQINIKKRIRKITSLFGIDLNKYDYQKIIDLYQLFDPEELINIRYNDYQSFNKHPKNIEIKSKYKFIKSELTIQDKTTNKKNKKMLKNELTEFKNYLETTNEIFIICFFILFFIQTANPPYPIHSKFAINLWDFSERILPWKDIEKDLSSHISMKTVDTIVIILQKMIQLHKKDDFWITILSLLSESQIYKDIPNFNKQFINISNHITKNEFVKNRIKNYYQTTVENKHLLYLNEHWNSYKPLFNHNLVINCNRLTNEELKVTKNFLIKKGPNYAYENISSVRSFEEAFQIPRFQQLKIPFSEIMNNQAYERLFNFSIHLHGTSKSTTLSTLNLLIQNFIDTISDKKIEPMLIKSIGWNSKTKTLKNVDFSKIRYFFVKEITEYFKNKNKEDVHTINLYIHIHINNWNGILLNGNPKRNYNYIPPVIYPNESYEDLLRPLDEDKKEDEQEGNQDQTNNFIDKLFKRFCLNEKNEIVQRFNEEKFIYHMFADPMVKKDALCFKMIPKTKENFYKILEYKRNLLKLPIPKKVSFSKKNILKLFLRNNNLLKNEANDYYPFLKKIYSFNNDTSNKEYRSVFNEMYQYNSFMINKIQDFFIQNDDLSKEQLLRMKSNFGRSIDSISILINKLLEDTTKINSMIHHTISIVSRLSNRNPLLEEIRGTSTISGVYFHDYIPKQWKLSDTNKNHLQTFLNYNEFLSHSDTFIPSQGKVNQGYYQYQKEREYYVCFQGLCSYIKQFYKSDYNTIVGDNKTPFNEEFGRIFNRFNFLMLFSIMIDYIESLNYETFLFSDQANYLFTLLEVQEKITLNRSIELCTNLVYDLLLDHLEAFIDTNWIYQIDHLSNKLSRQREREKQGIIDSLESKTEDARLVIVQQQKCGLSNYFHSATDAHLSHIHSEEYANQIESERSDFAKELFSQYETELEVAESIGIDTERLLPSTVQGLEIESGYSQKDVDQEFEGSVDDSE